MDKKNFFSGLAIGLALILAAGLSVGVAGHFMENEGKEPQVEVAEVTADLALDEGYLYIKYGVNISESFFSQNDIEKVKVQIYDAGEEGGEPEVLDLAAETKFKYSGGGACVAAKQFADKQHVLFTAIVDGAEVVLGELQDVSIQSCAEKVILCLR